MSKTTKIILGVVLSFMVLIGGTVGYVVSAKFTAEKYEQAIYAQDESMQNTWGMMEQQLKLSGVTVKNYGETFIKSLEANAKRYENDKGAMMKFVRESSGSMSPDLHKTLMKTIEKVYSKKESRQLSKISVVQEYRTYLKTSIKGSIASSFFSYPTEKGKLIMNRIISTKQTKETWKDGIDKTPNLF